MKRPVKISRHALRRMQLYKINKNDIIDLLKKKENELVKGERLNLFFNVPEYNYPLKIVLFSDDSVITIIVFTLTKEN